MKILIGLLVMATMAHPLGAQNADTERQLVAARDTIWRAFFRNDTALLRRYLPPAAATLEGTEHRWSNRNQIAQSARDFVRGRNTLVSLTFANTDIAQTGHSALVRSNYQTVVESGGRRDTSRGRATELFVKLGTTWVNPYWQLEPENRSVEYSRDIPLPDTLGASFSIADSAAGKGTLADYDALIGTWEFCFQGKQQDGSFYPAFAGHWTFEKKTGGALIEDRWRPDDPSLPMAISLYTYRTFDPQKKVWQMHGTSPNGGEVQPGLTWSDGTNRYAIQRAHGNLTRIRYFSIDADHFLWRSDRSFDGGTTWILDFGIMEAKRIAR